MIKARALNQWPVVKFDPVPFANQNHPSCDFVQEIADYLATEAILIEFKTERLLDKVKAEMEALKQKAAKLWGIE